MEDEPKSHYSDIGYDGRDRNDPIIGKKFFSKYRVIKKLGEGSFGKVYKAVYNNEYFALKFENRLKNQQNMLEHEATIMTYLKGPNIPMIKSYGYCGDYNILVMQFLDRSLEDIFDKIKKFTVKTTCMLGYQMVNVLQFIHDRHIIHRDIKPDNFVMGAKENNAHLYLLDFGLAKKYRSSKTLIQCPYIKKKKLTGTARYASIHALEEMEQSRRDDLESVGYVLMYFLRGSLPWQGLKIKSKEGRYKGILVKKKETSSEELCRGFPDEFKEFVEYAKKLDYYEQPDYEMLKSKFFNLVTKTNGEAFDYIYDWTTESDIKKRKVEYPDLAPSTNEKKSTQKEMESTNSNKKKINQVHVPNNKITNTENMDANNIVIDGLRDNNNGYKSKCCTIF